VDALVLPAGPDLLYFTGYEAMPLERPTLFALTPGRAALLLVPELEVPRVGQLPEGVELEGWAETQDPLNVIARWLGSPSRVAIGDQAWASVLLGLQARLPRARFGPASPITRDLRMRKDAQEVACLRRAAQAADRVMAGLARRAFAGKRERDLAREVAELIVEEGHDVAAFAIVAAGENGASPHHEPGDREVREGDTVVVDLGGRRDRYFSDTTRCFSVGPPDPEYRRLYGILRQAHEAAVALARPGVRADAVDRAARAAIEAAGLGRFFVHRTGHGIGLEAHEHPYIVEGNDLLLETGMTFSVEPGIYLPGRFGMRLEDIVVVTGDGAQLLNGSPREIVEVG
jgi:Xaa-Pro aminopeptidase